jgi:hypothetical protein
MGNDSVLSALVIVLTPYNPWVKMAVGWLGRRNRRRALLELAGRGPTSQLPC